MSGARSSSSSSKSDDIAEALSTKPCSVVLDSSLPDSVNEMSQCLESSVGHDRQNEKADEPAEADSDSGDSLFMTQISAPEAERTRRRRRSPRSDPASFRDLEGSGSDASLSDSPKVSKSTRERRRLLICRLPKYRFSFVSGEKGKLSGSVLRNGPNISLNNCIMGGFFKCVREQWIMCRGGEDDDRSTVDMDGKCISPLSEEEEEKSEDEDIKVVKRKCFVATSKAKRQQSWSNHLKQEKTTRNGGNARRETSQRRRCKTREKGDETVSLQQKAREEELSNDGDAAVCEAPKKRRSSRLCAQKHREASTTATEPQTDVLLDISQTENEHDSPDLFESLPDLQSDTNNDSEPREKNGKKEKKGGDHESIEEEEEEKGHGREEPEGLHAATSASQTSDELEFNERNYLEDSLHDNSRARQEEGDVPDSKQKKKKRKKSAAENVSQETDVNLESGARVEDSGFSESCNVENGGKKKKKKRKRNSEDEEHLQSREDPELLSDDAEIKKKKKKRKKEKTVIEEEKELNRALDLPPVSTGQVEELGNGLEDTTAHEETLESSCVKRKSLKKKKKLSFSDDAAQDKEEVVEVSFSNDAVTLEESTDMSLKKKKKKKKTISEEVDISHTPEENEKVECKDDTQQTKEVLEADAELVTKKKKKKKKKKTTSGEMDISNTPEENEKVECDDNTGQTKEVLEADAELVTKKKKKKKKTTSGEMDISHIPEENETVEDDTQKIKDAEKKKKKGEISEIFGRNISEDSVAQSDDSVSLRKKEKKKKRTTSFLAADVEENGLQTHGGQNRLDFETESAKTGGNLEESINGVGKKKKKKRKRKRKVSEEQDSVENDHELDFGEPKEPCQSALPETVDTGVKRKKMKKKSVDQACHEIQGSPPTATEDGNQTLSDIKEKKRTKRTDDNLLEGHSELQLQESKKKKKKERNKQSAVPDIVSSSPALSETSVLTPTMSFSDSIMKKKQKKVKHALH